MVLKCEQIFESMKPYVESKKEELTKRINAVYAFEVLPSKGKPAEKIWTVDLKKGFKIKLIKAKFQKEELEISMPHSFWLTMI